MFFRGAFERKLQSMTISRNEQIRELASIADIAEIAEELGLHLTKRQSSTPKTLCPFHDDHNPSLTLYRDTQRYHCYACGEHGDVYDLVKKCKGWNFQESVQWLADRYAFTLAPIQQGRKAPHTPNPRQLGLLAAVAAYQNPSEYESKILGFWSKQREFTKAFLKKAEVYAGKGNKLSLQFGEDREALENLDSAGLIYRHGFAKQPEPQQTLSLDVPPRDVFSRDRIIFTLRDSEGSLAGFAGRACSDTDKPKYLYSKGFPRSKILYRLHDVKRRIREEKPKEKSTNQIDLFVVEGLTDALRLESHGQLAVAVLGTELTQDQIGLIRDLSSEIDRKNQVLAIHLFFDLDNPGQQAMEKMLIALLKEAGEKSNFLIDVILPQVGDKKDPDEIFRDITNKTDLKDLFRAWSLSPIEFLIGRKLQDDIYEIDLSASLSERWENLPLNDRFVIKRNLERCFSYPVLRNLVDRDILFTKGFSTSAEKSWGSELRRFFSVVRDKETPTYSYKQGYSDKTCLLHAFQVALSSTQRREFPIDQGSWDRIQKTFDLAQYWMQEKLSSPVFGRDIQTEPMLAVRVPRQDSDYRDKALPCPEDLVLQQYLLDELLKSDGYCNEFRLHIPAIRYESGNKIITTWEGKELPTVSFAYQVDIDVLEGRQPPRNGGMYRGYYDCWSSFVQYIDERVTYCPYEQLYVARLDIRRYYDQLHRDAIYKVLHPALVRALKVLEDNHRLHDFAPLFDEKNKRNGRRDDLASRVVDWFLDHSFDYTYYDPKDGSKKQSGSMNRGIPQGPDLSAYLANIALFPLDNLMREKIEELDKKVKDNSEGGFGKYGGAYARYVDDIILVVPTESKLQEMKSLVSESLTHIGLELSQKTIPLPPMSREEISGWLTDRRGGLGVSGPFAGPQDTPPILHIDPLVDAGEIDRSDSLSILHNSTLDDPQTPVEEILESVATALLADELRHGDYGVAAMRVWSTICYEDLQTRTEVKTSQDIADCYIAQWNSCLPENPGEHISLRHYFAALDGMERLLHRQPHRNPTLPESSRQDGLAAKTKMAKYILDDVFISLENKIDKENGLDDFRHMVLLKKMSLVWQAKTILADDSTPITSFVPKKISHYDAIARHLFSLAEVFQNNDYLAETGLQSVSILKFHLAITLLTVYATCDHTDPSRDPLSIITPPDTFSTVNSDSLLEQIVQWWKPSETTNVTEDAERWKKIGSTVSRIFIELLGNKAIGLLIKKQRGIITKELLFCTPCSHEDLLRIIPAPTQIGVPGLTGYCDCDGSCRYAFLCKQTGEIEEKEFSPDDLSWVITPSQNNTQEFCRRRAALNSWERFPGIPNDDSKFRRTAHMFRKLHEFYEDMKDNVCPPTFFNILYDQAKDQWNVLGFRIPAEDLKSQAFIRNGQGLRAEPVPANKDYLWRIGTVIADFLQLVDYSYAKPWLKLTLPPLEADQWADQSMMISALTRLRGKYVKDWPLKIHPDSGLPHFVERTLAKLEQYPASDTANKINKTAFRLAMIVEGRAFHHLEKNAIPLSMSGGPATMLAEITERSIEHDENIASFFEEYSSSSAVDSMAIPKRRAAKAWFNLAERFRWLATNYSLSDEDPTIRCLQFGTMLQSIQAEIRGKVLELWQLLSTEQKTGKCRERYDILSLELNDDLFLSQKSEALVTSDKDVDTDPLCRLFVLLDKATQDSTTISYGRLKSISLLGWTLLWGALRNYIPNSTGFAFDDDSLTFKEIVEKIALSQAPTEDQVIDPPWGEMLPVVQALEEPDFIQRLFRFLNNDDAGIHGQPRLIVEQVEHELFTVRGLRGKDKEVTLAGKRKFMPQWTILEGKFHRDRDYESIPKESDSDGNNTIHSHLFRWSETRCDGKLLGISTVAKGLASASGLDKTDLFGNPSTTIKKNNNETKHVETNIDVEKHVEREDKEPDASVTKPLKTDEKDSRDSLSDQNARGRGKRAIDSLLSKQRHYWKARSHKYKNHVRVALLQWRVDDTYHHPLYDLSGDDLKKAKKSDERLYCSSRIELRRQRILAAALEACAAFQVDILLLPEYSVRPETLQFLLDELHVRTQSDQKSDERDYHGTVVWAGTFRKPPGMTFERLSPDLKNEFVNKPSWSSILAILNQTKIGNQVFSRCKKYPSLAANEIIFPEPNKIEPAYVCENISSGTLFIPWLFATELICSESFLASSPSNLLSIAQAHVALSKKFGDPLLNTSKGIETVRDDIVNFSTFTSLNSGKLFRRTVLLLPAMSSRTQDYTLLGQSLYLSTGITTVFCNAISSEGHGRSCFIGYESWDVYKKEGGETTDNGPYHGVLPGIFRQNSTPRGCLDKEEQSMVIADIDPLHAIHGHPRQQVISASLSLVAHLPIIESAEIQTVTKERFLERFNDLISTIEKVKKENQSDRQGISKIEWNTAVLDDVLYRSIIDTLQEINTIVGSKGKLWLGERIKSFQEHHKSHPQMLPPPVAIDWLWVDTEISWIPPEIEIPPYSSLPGDRQPEKE